MLGSTETIKPYAVAYARYIFLAAPFMMCSFIMNNLLRLQGLAAYAMLGIASGGILNIFLDPIFIFGLDLGTAGAAIATGLSQFTSFCILLCQCNLRKSCVSIRFCNFCSVFLHVPVDYRRRTSVSGPPGNGVSGYDYLKPYRTPLRGRCYCRHGDCQPMRHAVKLRCSRIWPGLPASMRLFLWRSQVQPRKKRILVSCVKVSTIFLLCVSVIIFLFSGHAIELFRERRSRCYCHRNPGSSAAPDLYAALRRVSHTEQYVFPVYRLLFSCLPCSCPGKAFS